MFGLVLGGKVHPSDLVLRSHTFGGITRDRLKKNYRYQYRQSDILTSSSKNAGSYASHNAT